MMITLTPEEWEQLKADGISFDETRDCTEDEALDLLERIRQQEVFFSQDESPQGKKTFALYASLGDSLFAQIPE